MKEKQKKKKKKKKGEGRQIKDSCGGRLQTLSLQLEEIRNHVWLKWYEEDVQVYIGRKITRSMKECHGERRRRRRGAKRQESQSGAATSVYLQRLWPSCIIIRDRVTSRGSQVLDLTCVPGARCSPGQDIKNIKKNLNIIGAAQPSTETTFFFFLNSILSFLEVQMGTFTHTPC